MKTAITVLLACVIGFGFGFMIQWNNVHHINKRNRALLLLEKNNTRVAQMLIGEIIEHEESLAKLKIAIESFDGHRSSNEFLKELIEIHSDIKAQSQQVNADESR